MSLKRYALCLPVVAALVLTGSAVARIAPAEGEGVKPQCAKNGVHENPQGHLSCGLHTGWAARQAATETEAEDKPAAEPTAEEDTAGEGTIGTDEGIAEEPAAEKVCKKNGVHINKNGHPTCGLHKGWTKHDPAAAPADGAAGKHAGKHEDKHAGKYEDKGAGKHGGKSAGKHGKDSR